MTRTIAILIAALCTLTANTAAAQNSCCTSNEEDMMMTKPGVNFQAWWDSTCKPPNGSKCSGKTVAPAPAATKANKPKANTQRRRKPRAAAPKATTPTPAAMPLKSKTLADEELKKRLVELAEKKPDNEKGQIERQKQVDNLKKLVGTLQAKLAAQPEPEEDKPVTIWGVVLVVVLCLVAYFLVRDVFVGFLTNRFGRLNDLEDAFAAHEKKIKDMQERVDNEQNHRLNRLEHEFRNHSHQAPNAPPPNPDADADADGAQPDQAQGNA